MRVIGFDSKAITRFTHEINKADGSETQSLSFQALLGVGVGISDYTAFAAQYDAALDDIFAKYSIPRMKRIYKSHDLVSIFQGVGIDAISEIIQRLTPHIESINIYVTHFATKPGEQVTTCGIYYEEKLRNIRPIRLLDLIRGEHAAICCYAYLFGLSTGGSSISTMVPTTYYIDDCPGMRPSVATRAVIGNPNVKILFRGDQVNYAVSMADFLCGYIDHMTERRGIFLNEHLVSNLGLDSSKTKSTPVGYGWLSYIKPAKDVELSISHKYPHPIYFFFVDQNSPFGKETKEVMENSDLFRNALDAASKAGGTVKFFHPADQQFITSQDFLVTQDDSSESKINYLFKQGCKAKKIDSTHF